MIYKYLFLLIPIVVLLLFFKKNITETFTENKNYNLAYYTCFYGDNNNIAFIIPKLPSNKYDCYYFSNNKDLLKKLDGTKWIQIYDEVPITNDEVKSAMYSKHVKALPEDFAVLNKYDYLCYLDSKLEKISEKFVEKYIKRFFINKNYALLLRHHPFLNNNVWNEFNESMKQKRYESEKEKYLLYIKEQLKNGLKETTTNHATTNLLIRNMKHPKINEIDKTWYSHIQQCGIECQISFFFVKQLFENNIYIFKTNPFEN